KVLNGIRATTDTVESSGAGNSDDLAKDDVRDAVACIRVTDTDGRPINRISVHAVRNHLIYRNVPRETVGRGTNLFVAGDINTDGKPLATTAYRINLVVECLTQQHAFMGYPLDDHLAEITISAVVHLHTLIGTTNCVY